MLLPSNVTKLSTSITALVNYFLDVFIDFQSVIWMWM